MGTDVTEDNIKIKKPHFRAVILTAFDKEFKALEKRFKFQNTSKIEHVPTTDKFWKGFVEMDGCVWEIFYGITGQKNVASTQATERILSFFSNDKPDIALFMGVARAMKDVVIGDVAISNSIQYYESGKFDKGQWFHRSNDYNISREMENLVKEIRDEKIWMIGIQHWHVEVPTKAVLGPIVSGEKVIGDIDETDFQWIMNNSSGAIALEMEGHGFFKTLHDYGIDDRLVIRGISDLGVEKSIADKKGSQEIAADNAAAFTFEVLRKYSANRLAKSPIPANEESSFRPGDTTSVSVARNIEYNWLDSLVEPTFLSKMRIYPPSDFYGRKWLYKNLINPHFVHGMQNIYVISAGKGFGKTYLSCCSKDKVKNFAGIFICDTSDSFSCYPINWINSIIKNLSIRHPLFKEHFLKVYRLSELLPKDPVTYFNEFFNHLPLPEDLNDEFFVFVLDGLDEAEAKINGKYGFRHLLEQINPPPFLKILVTKRYDQDLHSVWRQIVNVRLDFNSDDNQEDLKGYVDTRFKAIIEKGTCSISPEFKSQLLKQLKSKSAGNFLYASLILDDVENGFSFEGNDLPRDLDNLYNKMFENRFSSHLFSNKNCSYEEQIKPVLAMLCTNNRIPRKFLPIKSEDSFKLIKQFLNEYVNGPADEYEYELFHKSFRTWLEITAEKTYRITINDLSLQHKKIADLCEKILANPHAPSEKIQDYARKNVVSHHIKSGDNENYQRTLVLFKSPDYIISRCEHNEIYDLNEDIHDYLKRCPTDIDAADLLRFLISRLTVLLKYPKIIPQEIKNFGPAFLSDNLSISKPWLNLENKYTTLYVKKFDEHESTISKIRVIDGLLFVAGGNPPSYHVSIWDIKTGKYSRLYPNSLIPICDEEKIFPETDTSLATESGNSNPPGDEIHGSKGFISLNESDTSYKTASPPLTIRSIEVMMCEHPEYSYRIYLGCLHNTIKTFDYSSTSGQILNYHEVLVNPVSHPSAETGDEITITDIRILPKSQIMICRGNAVRKDTSLINAPPQPCEYSIIFSLDISSRMIVDTMAIDNSVTCVGVTDNTVLFGCDNGMIGTCNVDRRTGKFNIQSFRQQNLHKKSRVNSVSVNGTIAESSDEDGKIIKWYFDPILHISHYDLTWTKTRHAETMAGDSANKEIFCSLRIAYEGKDLLIVGTNGVIIIEREVPGSEGKFEFLQSIHAHAKAVTNLTLFGDYLISSSNDETIKIWSLSDILKNQKISGSEQQFYRKVDLVEFSNDGRYCFFASSPMMKNSFVKVWDLGSGHPQFMRDIAGKKSIISLKALKPHNIVICELRGIIRYGDFMEDSGLFAIDNTCSGMSYADIIHHKEYDLICCGAESCKISIIDPRKDLLENIQEFYPKDANGHRLGNEQFSVVFNTKGEINYIGNRDRFLRDIKTYRRADSNYIVFCTEEKTRPKGGILKIFNFDKLSKEYEHVFDLPIEKIFPFGEMGVIIIIFNEGSIGVLHIASHQFSKIENTGLGLLTTLMLNTSALILYTFRKQDPGVLFEFLETLIQIDHEGIVTIDQHPTGLSTYGNVNAVVSFLRAYERFLVTANSNKEIIVWRKTPGCYEEVCRFVCEIEVTTIKYHNYNNKPRLICGGNDGRIYFIALENFGGV